MSKYTKELDDLHYRHTALESYNAIVADIMERNGELDSATIQAVNKGLECLGFGAITNRFVSLEDHDNSDKFLRQVSSESYVSDLKEKVSKTGSRYAEAFRKFIKWIQDLYSSWIANGANKVKRIRSLIEEVRKASSIKNIELSNPTQLMIGDKLVIDPDNKHLFQTSLELYEKIFRYVALESANDIIKYTADVLPKIMHKSIIVVREVNGDFTDQFISQMSLDKNDEVGLNTDNEYWVSDMLPGNYYFYVEKMDYNGVPYPYVGFKQSSTFEPVENIWYESDKTYTLHLLNALAVSCLTMEKIRANIDRLGRLKINTAMVTSTELDVYYKTVRGIFGEIAPVLGQFDRFVKTILTVIERSIVK